MNQSLDKHRYTPILFPATSTERTAFDLLYSQSLDRRVASQLKLEDWPLHYVNTNSCVVYV